MRFALLLSVFLSSVAWADHTVSAGGFGSVSLGSFNQSPGVVGATVGWLMTRGHFAVGAGLRASVPTPSAPVPLEGYARVGFATKVGPWEPLLAPELGLSGLMGFAPPLPMRPTDFAARENALTGVFYVAFHTELLRFRLGRVVVSAAAVDVGTSLSAAGTVLRLQLDYLTVGVRW